MFFGRTKELNKLKEKYNSDKFESIIVSGKRRVGKSSLILESLKDCNCKTIYYEWSRNDLDYNLEWLSNAINLEFNQSTSQFFSSIESALEFLFEKSLEEKIIFVIDEYPYLIETIKFFDGVLKKFIDKYHQKSKMKLLITGSYVKTMNELKNYNAPLYGRFTYELVVKDFNYFEASLFYPNYSLEDKVKAYAVFGGTPYYLQFINPKISIDENIEKNILENKTVLDSPSVIYVDEIKNIPGSNAIFTHISNGKNKLSDLYNSFGKSSSHILFVLEPLTEMGLIVKETPINMLENRKRIFYYIEDNFLDFYYRYISAYKTLNFSGSSKDYYKRFIKEDLENTFIPKKFEKIVKQYLIEKNIRSELNVPFKNIGKYWHNDSKRKINVEFDVVYLDYDGVYNFIEVKYSKNKIKYSTIKEELFQIQQLDIKNFKMGFASKSGFDLDDDSSYLLIDLKDIYSL